MKKYAALVALAAVATASASYAAETTQPVSAPSELSSAARNAKALYNGEGRRVASIYRILADGSPQVILDGRLITVPTSSLSEVNGKLVTSLTKREIVRGK